MKKIYSIGSYENNEPTTEKEEKSIATEAEINAFLKDDGYDDLRRKAFTHEYLSERKNALEAVEHEIAHLKKVRTVKVPETTIRPFEDRVLIFPDKPLTVTGGGLYVPKEAQEKDLPETGTVVAKGPGRNINGIFVPVTLEVGDRVYYGKYAGTMITDKKTKEQFLVMRFGDIFCLE